MKTHYQSQVSEVSATNLQNVFGDKFYHHDYGTVEFFELKALSFGRIGSGTYEVKATIIVDDVTVNLKSSTNSSRLFDAYQDLPEYEGDWYESNDEIIEDLLKLLNEEIIWQELIFARS